MLIAMTRSQNRLTDPKVVAYRLRAHMGAEKIARTTVTKETGINRTSLADKLDGKTAFSYDEMDKVLAALGLSWGWLVTGVQEGVPTPPPLVGMLPQVDSNHQPADLRIARAKAQAKAQVKAHAGRPTMTLCDAESVAA